MTRSRSEEGKRPWCAVPVRAIIGPTTHNQLKVLLALGYHANRKGVCWPSLTTLMAETKLSTNTVQDALKWLVEHGYIRRLKPNDYDQVSGQWGKSNRYQVLWAGDDELPTYEDLADARPMQSVNDQATTSDGEGSGARGSADTTPATMRTVAAFASAVEAATGVRPAGADLAAAARLNDETPGAIHAAVRTIVAAKGRVPSWLELEAALGRS
jgi:hypothetical protein